MTIASRVAAIAVLVAAAAGGGYFFFLRQSDAKVQPQSLAQQRGAGGAGARGVPVTLGTVEQRSVPLALNLVGRTEAYSTVTLRSRLDGQITGVHYQAGQPVRRGQKMVSLDSRALQAQLQQGEANLARDRAQLAKAQADLARYNDLVAKGFVSPAQLDTFRATVDSLEATVRADMAAVELARVNLGFTTIAAPMDGIAGAVLVFPGGSVKANDTPLVVVNQVKPLYVTFSVPEARLAEIGRDRDGKTMRVDVRLPGDKGTPMTGALSFVDNTVDAATGTIIMKARLDNAEARLTPGQFVEVSVRLRELPDAMVMPAEALQTGPDGTFVYVAKADQTVEVRPISARPLGPRQLMVERGLKPGERVVTDGQLRLAPGSRYEVRDGPPRREGAKGEAGKGEGAKGEAGKGEGAKGEGAKGEGAKGEGAKGEGGRSEAAKSADADASAGAGGAGRPAAGSDPAPATGGAKGRAPSDTGSKG